MSNQRSLSSFKCLTFDCFGTLVDWETGIYTSLLPLTEHLPSSHPLRASRAALLRAFIRHEDRIRDAHPTEIYSRVLAAVYADLAAELGLDATEEEKARFGASIGDWRAFPDTVEALRRLQRHFKLVILSNVDRESFGRTLSGPLREVTFDAVYTAQDIGSYKPDLRNFEYLIEHCDRDLGVSKEGILHTAYALFHDLEPAKQIGLAGVWIERSEIDSVIGGNLEEYAGRVDLSWHFQTLKEMADAADADFAETTAAAA